MNTATRIRNKLTHALAPDFLEIIDESHQHQSGKGAESHFKVIIVSAHFCKQTLLKRHRSVYAILQEEMQYPVHALALHTYTPDEWRHQAPASPQCAGKSSHTT